MSSPRSRAVLVFLILTAVGCTGSAPALDEGDSAADAPNDGLPTALWLDHTESFLPETGAWTNKVELADLDGDGLLDLLFANGGNYSEPGEPELNGAWLNRGGTEPFDDVSEALFGSAALTRVIKARDVDGDGDVDVFVGNTYQSRSRLLMGQGDGTFRDASADLPARDMSLGDAEFGDADGDGDLDLLLADWGPGNNMTNAGGRTRLWLNNGAGRFTDATENRMPDVLVRFSWDLEFVDVDNDMDLDVLVSCKRCPGSLLFHNDGTGRFTEDGRGIPQYTNNYEFEPMDLDGDGFLDLVTINDGEIVGERGSSRREHVFRNDGEGRFRDATDGWWPDAENIGEDDNMVAFLDYDSDGDADFLIGSLSGPDRLLINDGTGHLTTANEVFEGEDTPGTLGMAIGDLDGDSRIDVVQAQGEHPTAIHEKIHLGTGLAPDTSPPVIGAISVVEVGGDRVVRVRVHDRKSPSLATEWQSVEVRHAVMGAPHILPMRWYGEYLWRVVLPAEAEEIEVCATDAAGNEACSTETVAAAGEGRS
jgi:hypothetical protein